jgi:uncharacterized surface protein with fasciclin (FAS1) repeats
MNDVKKLSVIVLLLVLAVGMAAPTSLAQTSDQKSLFENLMGRSDLTTIAGLAKAAGLDTALSGNTPYTLFAPTNGALASIPTDSVKALVGNKPLLADLVKYHVIPGKVSYRDLLNMRELKTLDGKTLPVTVKNGVVSVAGNKIAGPGIESRNGVIYPVSSVMIPPGFKLPQVAAQKTQSTGIPMSWIGLILGAIALGALLLYLLTRGGHEAPKVEAPRRKVEEPYRAVRDREIPVEDISARGKDVGSLDIANIAKNLDLPLSGDALKGLNTLIGKGDFKDKTDFLGFLAKTFMSNNLGSAMAGGKDLPVGTILDIITKAGLGKGMMDGDIKKFLVPLFLAGFTAVYKYLTKSQAVKPV